MSAIFSAPIWFVFAGLAIPLLLVAASVYHASEIYEMDDDPDADVATAQSTLSSGTVIQTVEYPGFGPAKIVTFFGPFGIAANARPWAAMVTTCGLLLTAIGMVGLLHFPSRVPVVNYESIPFDADSNRDTTLKLRRIDAIRTPMVTKTDAVSETPRRYDGEVDHEHEPE